MIQKSLLILFCLMKGISFACSCAYSNEFTLLDYDSHSLIFEVKIESKYMFEEDSLQRDTIQPPSLYQMGLTKAYKIKILNVFKGDLKLSEKIMEFSTGSSCSWTPELGTTYIFYANDLNNVQACNRKLTKKYDKQRYRHEKSILEMLETQPPQVKIKRLNHLRIEGQHNNGKRDGTWKIYSDEHHNEIVFKLIYEKGILNGIEKGSAYSEENRWDSISYSYYLRQLNDQK